MLSPELLPMIGIAPIGLLFFGILFLVSNLKSGGGGGGHKKSSGGHGAGHH